VAAMPAKATEVGISINPSGMCISGPFYMQTICNKEIVVENLQASHLKYPRPAQR